MKKSTITQITIPNGYFEGNCYSCFHNKKKSEAPDGSIFCKQYNARKFPFDIKRCPNYANKIKTWIKIGLFAYFIFAFFVIIFENFILK